MLRIDTVIKIVAGRHKIIWILNWRSSRRTWARYTSTISIQCITCSRSMSNLEL